MHGSRSSRFVLGVLLLGSLTWTPSAGAQPRPDVPLHRWPSSLPDRETQVGKDKALWTSQLHKAKQIGQRALVGLQNAPADDSAPIDARVLQAVRDNYILLRAAKMGMEVFRGDLKFPDPLLDMAVQRITNAWDLARTPVNQYDSGMPRQEYLNVAVRDLSRSMQLLDQTLVLLP